MIVLAQNTVADGLQAGAEELVAAVLAFLPRLLAFIAILIVGYAAARLLRRLLASALERRGVGRALERGGIKDALVRADIDVGRLLYRLVFYGLLLLVLQLAFSVFGPNPVSDLLQRLIAFIPRVVVALVLIIVASVVARAVRDLIAALIGGLAYGRALALAAQLLIVGVGVFAALDQLAIAPTIVTGLFYALLATIVGVTVVAVGGGGIAPMRQRWERGLARADAEAVRMRDEARRQREAEEEARRQREAEEEARRQAEAEEEARRQREAEAQEEARRQREAEEEARRQREAEEEARRQREAQEEARRQAEA
ncbi:MAG TPA: hypothetical protein VK923_03625, partial [Euzebyales bacterium]|nr:hypothetical protein [Euzebyales bacterium]